MKGAYLDYIDQLYQKHSVKIAVCAAFLLPIRLNLCYVFLIPLITLYLLNKRERIHQYISHNSIAASLFSFVFVAAIISIFGLNPTNSLLKLARLAFFACTLLVFCDIAKNGFAIKLLLALSLGQTLSAVHSAFDAIFPGILPAIFIGKVSESGQLALTLVCSLGLTIFFSRSVSSSNTYSNPDKQEHDSIYELLWGCCNFALLCLLTFASNFKIGGFAFWSFFTIVAISLVASSIHALRCIRKPDGDLLCIRMFLLTTMLPLLANALLVNLKRGPWAGVIVGVLLLLLLNARKYLPPALLLIACLFITIEPLRARLEHSSEHFFIAGGRNVIWQIGTELTRQYPLGIGFGNSAFLQKFDPQIPAELRHFHNNFLNISVETGWLGLGIFLWWLLCIFRSAYRKKDSLDEFVLTSSLGCALLSWQVAGVVEYNFGDSEVVIIAFMVAGVLSGITSTRRTA